MVCILSILMIGCMAINTGSFISLVTTSTVSLTRDRVLQIYVSVKVKESGLSKIRIKLDILKHLSKVKSDHPGWSHNAASLLLRHLWIGGPNRRHLALIFQVRGPSISRLYYLNIRLHSCIARSIAVQVIQGFEYLHSDVLFQLTNFDSGSEYKLKVQLGSPSMLSIDRLPGRPCYFLVDSASFFNAEPGLLTWNITIVDNSKSLCIKSPPAHEFYTTNYHAASKFSFETNVNFHSDIWALGCFIYEMHAGFHLFSPAIDNRPAEAVGENYPDAWKDPFTLHPCSI